MIDEKEIISPHTPENGTLQVIEEEPSRELSNPDVEIVKEAEEEEDSYADSSSEVEPDEVSHSDENKKFEQFIFFIFIVFS